MAYATKAQLAAVLPGITAGGSRDADLDRALDTAAGEITTELGWTPSDATAAEDVPENMTLTQVLALCESVNLERAADLWHMEQVPSGLLLANSETPLLAPRNSWDRYAHRLAPAKKVWGLA